MKTKKIILYSLILIALSGIFHIVSITKTVQAGAIVPKGDTKLTLPVSAATPAATPATTTTPAAATAAKPAAAAATPAADNTNYTMLSPLPGLGDANHVVNVGDPNAFSNYLNKMITLIIGLSAVMAVVMIVIGGIEYMTSELPGNKESGTERMTNAVLGLVIALAAYALLYTINPDLLKSDLSSSMKPVTLEATDSPQVYNATTKKYPNGATYGAQWDDSVGKIATLPANVTVYNNGKQCTFIGETGCTSTRGLNTSAVEAVQKGCGCALQISGGTESWLHGGATGSTSHQLGSSTVDLLTSPKLDAYLSGGKPLINMTRYPPPNGQYLYETSGGAHWHVGP